MSVCEQPDNVSYREVNVAAMLAIALADEYLEALALVRTSVEEIAEILS